MKLVIDPDTMTVRDMEDFETVSGHTMAEFVQRFQGQGEVALSAFPAKMLTAMVWIFGRKSDPAFTLEDARDTRLAELEVDNPPSGANGPARSSNGSRNSRASTGSRRRNSGA